MNWVEIAHRSGLVSYRELLFFLFGGTGGTGSETP